MGSTFGGVTLKSALESYRNYEKLAEKIGERGFESHVVQTEVIILGREIERLRIVESKLQDARHYLMGVDASKLSAAGVRDGALSIIGERDT